MRDMRSIFRSKMPLAVVLAGLGGLALAGWHGTGKTTFCAIDDSPAGRPAFPAGWFDPSTAGQGSAVAAGRPAPRLLTASLPPDLGEIGSIEQRKRIFVSIVLPLAQWMNRVILADRRFVEKAVACGEAGRTLSPAARTRLTRLSAAYDAKGDLRMLRLRLDMVPPSLLLAQAAIESGWGTSRFAVQGNALFGQRTTAAGGGMQPLGLDAVTSVRVAAFPHLLASVRAYIHNLNTQPAYRAFRLQRADLRKQGRRLDGLDLATALVAYSERGAAYVRDLKAIIRDNRFGALDAIGTVPAVADTGSDA